MGLAIFSLILFIISGSLWLAWRGKWTQTEGTVDKDKDGNLFIAYTDTSGKIHTTYSGTSGKKQNDKVDVWYRTDDPDKSSKHDRVARNGKLAILGGILFVVFVVLSFVFSGSDDYGQRAADY